MWILENKNCICGSCYVFIGQHWSENRAQETRHWGVRGQSRGMGEASGRQAEVRAEVRGRVCLEAQAGQVMPRTKAGKVRESRLGRGGQELSSGHAESISGKDILVVMSSMCQSSSPDLSRKSDLLLPRPGPCSPLPGCSDTG